MAANNFERAARRYPCGTRSASDGGSPRRTSWAGTRPPRLPMRLAAARRTS
jgi:hypothetical protein